MGIRHSKKSHDIQSSSNKNGSTADTEVKIKELPEDAPVKLEEAKAVETIEEVAEKTAPNGDATAEQTQVEVSTVVVSVGGRTPGCVRGTGDGWARYVVLAGVALTSFGDLTRMVFVLCGGGQCSCRCVCLWL